MFLVAGGYDGSHALDLREIFDPLVGSWTASRGKLPRPMSAMRAQGNLLFGKY